MLAEGLAFFLGGLTLLRLGIRGGRRAGLLSRSFWLTFPQYARYRFRHLWPAPVSLAALILLIWGLLLLFRWLLAYYEARLGHPISFRSL